ncbi:hypothetical protein Leryth_012887 [Lithospermum erythrorhizon]|nr:hypothetical protein Leryth_012887 [Lithospermum erythrorhizon]
MGAANSKNEEDKALQLCRERKKFVRQALDGRCSLAATHITYIEALRGTGTALRKFVEPETPMYNTYGAAPDHIRTENSASRRFSFPSTPQSSRFHAQHVDAESNISPAPSTPPSSRFHAQHVDVESNISPSPSTPVSSHFHAYHVDAENNISPSSSTLALSSFQANHMKFRSTVSRKVEERPSEHITVSVVSSTPIKSTLLSMEDSETMQHETPPLSPTSAPWDFFGPSHPIDNHFASNSGASVDTDFEIAHKIEQREKDMETSVADTVGEKPASSRKEELQESEDEFDEPPAETLVRSFNNVNRATGSFTTDYLPTMTSADHKDKEIHDKIELKTNSPNLSPLRTTSSGVPLLHDLQTKPIEEDGNENKVVPKDFFLSIKDVEQLFTKASDSGRQVPRMLEANKFHYRPILTSKEGRSKASTLLKSCFSCGEDPSQVQEVKEILKEGCEAEPPQASVKYLTWHRTTSSRSSSSRNLLGANDDKEEFTNNIFDNFCMTAGSHASTLDRLHAWEKKLYDEVKASDILKREYEFKCKHLRELESRAESRDKIDKTRAVVKDLHSRIRVAIHRIDSISKKIEELRDGELLPQLEELIEGLTRMWELMCECHKLQVHIVSTASLPGSAKIFLQSDSKRHLAVQLENMLSTLASSFVKWIDAHKSYIESLHKWLNKCVSLPRESTRRNRRRQPAPFWKSGPPIYIVCGVWLEKFEMLPTKEVIDSIKGLSTEISHMLPRQEKHHGKTASLMQSTDENGNHEPSGDKIKGFDHLQTSLVFFLRQLNKFAESSMVMYAELQKEIEIAKRNYQQFRSPT